jgi:hypothetical protein
VPKIDEPDTAGNRYDAAAESTEASLRTKETLRADLSR